jgi:hypothetical protein
VNAVSLLPLLNDKHCFICGSKQSVRNNLLKETVGGNWLHKNCSNDITPKFKKGKK